MMAAIYVRVSTEGQDPSNQRPELEAMAHARGHELVAVYEETQSAAKHRPIFERMLEDARRARFQVLFVWALDRFGRSMLENVRQVLELDRIGVKLVSAREAWLEAGGNDEVRKLLLAIFSWVAEQERIRLGERTRAGLERARQKGKTLGRPRRVTPEQLEAARRMAADGRSGREMAVALKVPRRTLLRALDEAPAQKGGPAEGGGNDGGSGGSAPPER